MPLSIGKNGLLQACDQRQVVKWFARSVGRWRNPRSLAEWRNALLARRSNRHLDLLQRLGYARRCNGMILPWDETDGTSSLTRESGNGALGAMVDAPAILDISADAGGVGGWDVAIGRPSIRL